MYEVSHFHTVTFHKKTPSSARQRRSEDNNFPLWRHTKSLKVEAGVDDGLMKCCMNKAASSLPLQEVGGGDNSSSPGKHELIAFR